MKTEDQVSGKVHRRELERWVWSLKQKLGTGAAIEDDKVWGDPGHQRLRLGEGQDGGRQEGQGLADQELEGSSTWRLKPPRT